jgi:hypothetical protein
VIIYTLYECNSIGLRFVEFCSELACVIPLRVDFILRNSVRNYRALSRYLWTLFCGILFGTSMRYPATCGLYFAELCSELEYVIPSRMDFVLRKSVRN